MTSHVTQLGTPGIGAVPYGFHICHFYSLRQDLLGALIPYFDAGIKNNERCIWIASSALPTEEIRAEVLKVPQLEEAIAANQLTIVNAADWYGEPRDLNADAIIQRCLDEEERAAADGYNGLRITGNTSFVSRNHWDLLMNYERQLHNRLRHRRIVTFCAYDRERCLPVDMMEIVHRHDAALDYDDSNWQITLQHA